MKPASFQHQNQKKALEENYRSISLMNKDAKIIGNF